jgi:tetrahydromethanopterin:alpha-L-glutamate ligase
MPRSPDRLQAVPFAAATDRPSPVLEPVTPWVALVGDRVDWHARELVRALSAHGAHAVPIRLERCAFATTNPFGLRIDGFADRLPDAVIVRSMSGGTFEAVTRRLGILHALRELGVTVWNDARAIERCVDKSMTSFLLARAGIPTPATFVTENTDSAASWRADQPGDLVAKPLFGAQGRGLLRFDRTTALPDPAEGLSGVLYLQHYVGRDSEWRDFRVFVVGEVAVAAMARRGASWITNVARGGTCESADVAGRLGELAIAASRAVGTAYCGVDLIENEQGGLVVLEVNSMPAWKGLQGVAAIDIADHIARHVVTI